MIFLNYPSVKEVFALSVTICNVGYCSSALPVFFIPLSPIFYNLRNLLFACVNFFFKKKTLHDDYLLSVYCIMLITGKHTKLWISFIKYSF